MILLTNLDEFYKNTPEAHAISVGLNADQTYSYKAVQQRFSSILASLSCQQKDCDFAFIIAKRGVDIPAAILACLHLAIPLAIIDPRQGDLRIAEILSQFISPIAIVDTLGLSLIKNTRHNFIKDKNLVVLDETLGQSSVNSLTSLASVRVDDEATTAIVLFTSGSTGAPKGVCISRSDLDARLKTEVKWFSLAPQDTILGVLPLNFDVGITQLLAALYCGAHHVLLASWLPRDVIKGIDHWAAKGLAMSPVVWRGLLKFSDQILIWQTLNKMRYATLSGGALSESELRQIQQNLLDCEFIKTYGQTEMFRIASLKLSNHPDGILSVGKAYPGVKLEVLNADAKPCAVREQGEIVASGLGLMLGYIGAENGAVKARPTGDFGYLDELGCLFVCGRNDDMVKILDQRVYPDDVANSLEKILNKPVIVVVKNLEREASFIAFIEFDNDKDHMDEKQVLRLLRRKIASHLLPKQFVFLEKFPSTLTGKIDKQRLLALV